MPIYHCNVSIIKRSTGGSSVASAAYRSGEKIHEIKTGKTHDYTKKQGIRHSEIIMPDNAPSWLSDREQLWNAVELAEKRKDSQLAREVMVALPVELTPEQRLELVRSYIKEQFIEKGMIADLAIHEPNRRGDNRNHHAHILLTLRKVAEDGFDKKKSREWNAKANIYQWRKAWELHCNEHLKQAGLVCEVDCRSHAAKGLDQEPKLHLGAYATLLERNGIASDLGNENREIEKRNELRKTLHHQLAEINSEIEQLDTELLNAELNEVNDSAVLEHDEVLNPLDGQRGLMDELLNHLEIIKHETVAVRKECVEQYVESFNAYDAQVETYIVHVTDQKTQERLALQAKLYQTKFRQLYHTELASLLAEQDKTANAQKISQLRHLATSSKREYDKYLKEWAINAVRDDTYDYGVLDEKTIAMVEKVKAREQKHWSRFNAKAKSWSEEKIAREKDDLIIELDIDLADDFGLDRDYGLEL